MSLVRTCTSGRTGIFSYIILDNAQHIVRSSVIGITKYEFLSDNMKDETNKFMTSLE